MKICTVCKIEKSLDCFDKNKALKSGISNKCKNCQSIYNKNYKQQNKQKTKDYNKKYREDKKEEIRLQRQQFRLKNKEKRNAWERVYVRERRQIDPLFKLIECLRGRLRESLEAKRWRKNTKFSEYIGCSKEQLTRHIESQFESWMTWNNHGPYNKQQKTWHIDHIIPLSSAKNEEEMYKLCHYTNLKPLFSLDNIKKSNNF